MSKCYTIRYSSIHPDAAASQRGERCPKATRIQRQRQLSLPVRSRDEMDWRQTDDLTPEDSQETWSEIVAASRTCHPQVSSAVVESSYMPLDHPPLKPLSESIRASVSEHRRHNSRRRNCFRFVEVVVRAVRPIAIWIAECRRRDAIQTMQ